MRTFVEHMEFAMPAPDHKFGGHWTERKLEILSKYLNAYTTALKKKPFKKLYIDAFAGTGYRGTTVADERTPTFHGMISVDDYFEAGELTKGSARRALETEPPFDRYIFIEANAAKFRALEMLGGEFPELRDRIDFLRADANVAIRDLCRNTNWRQTRAVLFLDPYGMQVDWSTVECIAATKAIDLWYLFPVAAVHRCLKRDGEIPAAWAAALDRTLGVEDWREKFYRNGDPDLFAHSRKEKTADIEAIEKYVSERLGASFKGGVAKNVLSLSNSKGSCMFLLFFACANPSPKANRLAMKFANAILKP